MPSVVSATEAKNFLGRYLDESQKEPVTIEKMGRPFAVLVSQDEFESLQDAATKNFLGGRKSERCGFASTEDHNFVDDEEQWLKAKKGFDRIAGLTENWDQAGSSPPSEEALDYAWRLVTSIYHSACRRRMDWVAPHIGVDESSSVILEWWFNERKLTLYVETNGDVSFLKSWGSNIHTQMEDGMVDSIDEFVRLSKWLFQEGSK